MSQKSLPLTVEGFLERLKQEGFTCPQIHASLASRKYLVGGIMSCGVRHKATRI